MPRQEPGNTQWSSGFCDFTDRCCLCLYACYCYPCAAGLVHAQADKVQGSYKDCGIGHCIIPCILVFFLSSIGAGIEGVMGAKAIENATGLRSNTVADFFKSCCFPCCAVVQQRKHLDAAGAPNPGGCCSGL